MSTSSSFPFVDSYLHGDATVDVCTPQFSLGQSYYSLEPVKTIIFDRLPATALLVAGAVVFWLADGDPDRDHLGDQAEIAPRPHDDGDLAGVHLGAGLLARIGGAVSVRPGRRADPHLSRYRQLPVATTFSEKCWSLFLPWLVLAAASAAIYARYLRSSMIDVMSEDYIRTARAKGVSEGSVIMRHGVRSAITPIVTLLGLDIGLLLAGNAILTESVFNIPGIGRQIVTSIRTSDLPVIQGIVLFGAFFIIVCNLIVDIAYAYLDPRVRYQ